MADINLNNLDESKPLESTEMKDVVGGKVSMQDFHFVMKTNEAQKVQMQDFHFRTNETAPDDV